MTEQEQKRSRRRFLADMLFLGGGLTAAAVLAKNQLMPTSPGPQVMGEMVMPTDSETPAPVKTECPPATAGKPSQPKTEQLLPSPGQMALPRDAVEPPKTEGRSVPNR